jgi:hypothetical protein
MHKPNTTVASADLDLGNVNELHGLNPKRNSPKQQKNNNQPRKNPLTGTRLAHLCGRDEGQRVFHLIDAELHQGSPYKGVPKAGGLHACGRNHADALTRAGGKLKLHNPWSQSVQGEVSAHANVAARMKLCTNLPNDDVAGVDGLSAKNLDTAVLGLAVSTILCRTTSLFGCHDSIS